MQLMTDKVEKSTNHSFSIAFDRDVTEFWLSCDSEGCKKLLSDFQLNNYTRAVYRYEFPLQTVKVFIKEVKNKINNKASIQITPQGVCAST